MIVHPTSKLVCRCKQWQAPAFRYQAKGASVTAAGNSVGHMTCSSSKGTNAAGRVPQLCTTCKASANPAGPSSTHSDPTAAAATPMPASGPEQYEYMEFRGKWMLDGAGSTQELIELLLQNVEWFQQLQSDGWTLCKPVMHDVGQLRCPVPPDYFDMSNATTFTVQELQPPSNDTTVFPSLYHSPEHDAATPAADVGGIGDLSEAEVEYRASDAEDAYERMPVSAQNLLDGCEDINAIVARLLEHMDWLQGLDAEGWRLEQPVDDDQGVLVRRAQKKKQ